MKEQNPLDETHLASMEQPFLDLSEREKAFDRHVRRNFPWNFAVNLMYGLFGTTGWRLILGPIFVPAYIKQLAGTNRAVGLLLFCGGLFRFLMPTLTASRVEHRPKLKNTAVLLGAFMRLQVLLMVLAGFFLPARLNLIAFFIFYSLFSMFMGMQNVVYNTVMSKVIPVDRRGRFIGLRNFLGGITAALVALAAGSLLIDSLAFPYGYATTFLLAFVLTVIGLIFFAFSREAATPAVLDKSPVFERIRSIPSLLREDKNFANYVGCCAVGSLALMANPFIILYVQSEMSITGKQLGLFFMLFQLAQTTINLFFGRIADRRGFRHVFIISASLWAFAMLILVLVPMSYVLAATVFVILGSGVGGFRMSLNNMVLEFSDPAGRPMRIAIVNTISELANAVGPLFAGLMADAFSYKPVFVISILCTVSSLVLMWLRVTEPRKRRSHESE